MELSGTVIHRGMTIVWLWCNLLGNELIYIYIEMHIYKLSCTSDKSQISSTKTNTVEELTFKLGYGMQNIICKLARNKGIHYNPSYHEIYLIGGRLIHSAPIEQKF